MENVSDDKVKDIIELEDLRETKVMTVTILKVDKKKRLVTGACLVPEVVDAQGDIVSADVIEKSAHEFLMFANKNLDTMHIDPTRDIQVVESWISRTECKIAGKEVVKGTWLMTAYVKDEESWKAILDEELNGFSIQGKMDVVPIKGSSQ